MAPAPRKQKSVAYLLWCLGFFGLCGVHRLYTERYLLGILYLFTFGFCFLGQLIDLLLIPDDVGGFNDTQRQAALRRLSPTSSPSSRAVNIHPAAESVPQLQVGAPAAGKTDDRPLSARTRALLEDAKASMERFNDQA